MKNYPACEELAFELRHEISNNVVYATSKSSDQSAHMRSLIRAFASCLNISYSQNISLKEAVQACLSLHLPKCHIQI